MNYRHYNANPKGLYIDDCVIRAISVAEGNSWHETHNKLSRLSNKEGMLLNDVVFVEKYLDERYPRKCYKNLTIGEFAKMCPKGHFVVTTKGHIVAIIDNVIVDTWDSSKRTMKCCWAIETT